MKIRTLKKILKRSNTIKILTIVTPSKSMRFMINYVPKYEKLKCSKKCVIIIDKLTNISTKAVLYNMVHKVE